MRCLIAHNKVLIGGIRNPPFTAKSIISSIFFRSLMVFSALFPLIVSAQTPEWVYQYEKHGVSDISYAITIDSMGNTYTTGALGVGSRWGLGIIKVSNNGIEQWIYCNDSMADWSYGQDIVYYSNVVYVAGYAQFLDGNKDLIVLCVDSDGSTQWVYKDTVSFEANVIELSNSGMIYVVGFTRVSSLDIICLKLDSLRN